jgi:hypothetical protein
LREEVESWKSGMQNLIRLKKKLKIDKPFWLFWESKEKTARQKYERAKADLDALISIQREGRMEILPLFRSDPERYNREMNEFNERSHQEHDELKAVAAWAEMEWDQARQRVLRLNSLEESIPTLERSLRDTWIQICRIRKNDLERFRKRR